MSVVREKDRIRKTREDGNGSLVVALFCLVQFFN